MILDFFNLINNKNNNCISLQDSYRVLKFITDAKKLSGEAKY